jgi:hypothetical protein
VVTLPKETLKKLKAIKEVEEREEALRMETKQIIELSFEKYEKMYNTKIIYEDSTIQRSIKDD